jgi:hypothetical protein
MDAIAGISTPIKAKGSNQCAFAEALVLDTAGEPVTLFHQHRTQERHNLPLDPDRVSVIDKRVKMVPLAGLTAW